MPSIQVHRVSEDATMPTQATDRAQCIDLYAAEGVVIYPGVTCLIDLGIKVILPEGYGLEFRERSGLATKGIIIGAGIIDEDYHGTLKAVVRYMASVPPTDGNLVPAFEPFIIKSGDKIVQAELVKRIPISIEYLDEADFTKAAAGSERGEKGFGSTGQ